MKSYEQISDYYQEMKERNLLQTKSKRPNFLLVQRLKEEMAERYGLKEW